MELMSRIQTGRQASPRRVMVYGVHGIGKSTFGAMAPNPVFIQTEDGLGNLDCARFPLAESFDDVMAAIMSLYSEPHEFKTVVIDSLDWLERMIWAKVVQDRGPANKTKVENIEDFGFARGYTYALDYWKEILDGLNALRNERGMMVVLIAHAKIERFENPETDAYDRYSPRLNKHASALVQEWSDEVLFATYKVHTKQTEDPGPLPDDLLRIPGFISEVMDLSLRAAPYPNVPLAFCGALALQAFFGGRKVRDPADNRTNLYLIGLAYASSGKEFPRKVNAATMHAVGLAHCLGESFASGEGLQDSLNDDPCMLFQTDEIDGLLQSINKSKDARYEIVLGTLLKMYSTANGFYPMRKKAGKQRAETIEQPCLIIYGTAIPNEYYSALSERMLTNGFFARSIIIDGTKRGDGQEPSACNPTPRILETAQYWANFNPGKGNLEKFYPTPKIVPYTDDAKTLLIEARKACEVEYKLAEQAGDPVGTTVWGRTSEHIRKLALIYSISVNHREPSIDVDAANWATRFMMHQTKRMLFMAQDHVAANPFHAECLKLLKKLRDAGGRMGRNKLMRAMHLKMADFDQIVTTLLSQGDIVAGEIPSKTKPAFGYQLASEIRHNRG